MDKLYYSSLSSEQKEIIENKKTQASHRAITSMRQAEEVKQELLDSGFIEGQDFSFEDHEISTKIDNYEFEVVVNTETCSKSTWKKHEFEINYYAGSIKLHWKEVQQTYDCDEDQSHITPDNPSGWKIVDASEYLRLATKKFNRWDNHYYGIFGNYMRPLTISGRSSNFCKNYRDVRATNYLKRLREANTRAPEILEHKLEMQKQEMSRKEKIAKAKQVLTSQFDDIFLSKTKVVFNDYQFKVEIRFPEPDSYYACDTIYIDYEPDRNFECSVNKVENRFGFIPWDKVPLIEQLQTEQVEA